MFILYLPSEVIKPGRYKAQLEVDGSRTCDGRYPHFESRDGQFYNMIDITTQKTVNNHPKFDFENTSFYEESKVAAPDLNLANRIKNYNKMEDYSTVSENSSNQDNLSSPNISNKQNKSDNHSANNYDLYKNKSFSSFTGKKNFDTLISLRIDGNPKDFMQRLKDDSFKDSQY